MLGEPAEIELNWPGDCISGKSGGMSSDDEPDLFSVGAEMMVCNNGQCQGWREYPAYRDGK